MADTDTNGSNNTVTFDADPTLEAKAGGEEVAFDADIGGDTAGDAGAKRSPTQQLKDEASKFAGQAADRARAFAGEGKDRATGALDDVAKMLKSAAGDVDTKLGAEYGKYAHTAADSVAGFAESLRGKQVDDLLSDATDLVRKSPAIAVGVAAGLGFVLARLIKSGVDAAADLADNDAGPKV